uniref:Ubiquitin-like protease family profile domain-containing protein n=1 Tax=Chromera velia CCMP2878 TaxID=1169474 RepID=A0A0G4GC32_9ALVE|eukprot:Cvel_21251.t1-p1 / transcript=Cvel_21251.t1 / gene=Cvel_21251 / organism=Chromera_velia_CCMP2878 / gene_product=hypothetical protein / transcript_product=hypothetical protein / location=Cvel_scaffold1977:2420-5363(-) / protein_length=500 / sequence_SO=supercontig / SO=protein_coding / is_pseudo=false
MGVVGERTTGIGVLRERGKKVSCLSALELGLLLTVCLNVQCPRSQSNEAPQSPLCLGPTETDVMCNLPPFPTLQAPQSGRNRRPGGGSIETEGFGGAPILTDGDTAIIQAELGAEHLVLSALRIAEAKESAVATAGKLPDLSVPDPFPGSAALGMTVGARSPLLSLRSAGYTTKIVAQGESLAESATRMAIEEEMIENEQEEGWMGWLGSHQSGHSIDSDGLARLAPGRWLNDSAINFFGRVIAFLGAEFESSPPLTFVNSVATEMMKLIDIEAMQRTTKAADSQVVRGRGKATRDSTGSGNIDIKWKERETDLQLWWVHRLRRMEKRFKPYGGKDVFYVFNYSDTHWLAGYVKRGEKGAVRENETLLTLTVYTLDSLPPIQISLPGLLHPFFKATACGDDLIGGDDNVPIQAYALTIPCQRNGYDCGLHVLGWLIAIITGMDFQEVDHAVAARVRVTLWNVVTYVSEEPRWWAKKRGRSRVWGVLKGTLGSEGSEPTPP